jgi:hypothetical protein
MPLTNNLLFKADNIATINLSEAFSVDELHQKPHC